MSEEKPNSSVEDQLDRIRGRVTFLAESQRHIIAALDRLSGGDFVETIQSAANAGIETKIENDAALAGYRYELDWLDRIIHNRRPQS